MEKGNREGGAWEENGVAPLIPTQPSPSSPQVYIGPRVVHKGYPGLFGGSQPT